MAARGAGEGGSGGRSQPDGRSGAHRPLPGHSELAQAVAVLARAQQDSVWDRTQAGNILRSHLHEYSPDFLSDFQNNREGITSSVARTVLAAGEGLAVQDLRTDLFGTRLRPAGRPRARGGRSGGRAGP